MQKRKGLNVSLFQTIEQEFLEHLGIENNDRIIFSGKFGHGKTTFLKEFFSPDNQKTNDINYNVISLYPVNYSIASTEDIFRYIKYDIILEILTQQYDVTDLIEGYDYTLPKFLKENSGEIITAIVKMIPYVGKPIAEFGEKVIDFKKRFIKLQTDTELENNESDKLLEYLDILKSTEGSMYEDDLVSNMIEIILKRSKKNDEQSILIIDDLDRIDPEHIFRILNVFAAHFDRKIDGSRNKFGIDKVILVCDIDNIRNIFKAKYGSETDFNGYIDKFFSQEVFIFSHRKALADFAEDVFTPRTGNEWSVAENRYSSFIYNQLFRSSPFFLDILTVLFDNKRIDLRNLIKFKNRELRLIQEINLRRIHIDLEKFSIVQSLATLSVIKGGASNFKEAITNLNAKTLSNDKLHEYITILVYIVNVYNHKTKSMEIEYEIDTIPVKLIIDQQGQYSIKHPNSQSLNFKNEHLFWMMRQSVDFLHSHNVL